MSIISVYKCDRTGKLFEDKQKYRQHLKHIARELRIRSRIDADQQHAQEWWDQVHETEMSIQGLKQFIIDNQEKFWADAALHESCWKYVGRRRKKNIVMPVPQLVEFTEFKLEWSEFVSNSHSCPKNGVTNWGGKPDKPTSYPGWQGRAVWKILWPKEFDGWYPGSDLFRGDHCDIHSGSGGGGNWKDNHQTFGYNIIIFASDWPGLVRYREKQEMWKVLKQ